MEKRNQPEKRMLLKCLTTFVNYSASLKYTCWIVKTAAWAVLLNVFNVSKQESLGFFCKYYSKKKQYKEIQIFRLFFPWSLESTEKRERTW